MTQLKGKNLFIITSYGNTEVYSAETKEDLVEIFELLQEIYDDNKMSEEEFDFSRIAVSLASNNESKIRSEIINFIDYLKEWNIHSIEGNTYFQKGK